MVAVALAFALARDARASEIRDGNDFSVVLPEGNRVCLVFPAARFERAACPADAAPIADIPLGPDGLALAVGSVLVVEHGHDVRVGIIATRLTGEDTRPPDDVSAYARAMADAVAKSHPGARLAGEPEGYVVRAGAQSAARTAFQVDGLSKEGRAYKVVYTIWSENAEYVLWSTGLAASSHAVDVIADQMGATLHVAHPAPLLPVRSASYRKGEALGRLVGLLVIPGSALVAILVLLIGRQRRGAELRAARKTPAMDRTPPM